MHSNAGLTLLDDTGHHIDIDNAIESLTQQKERIRLNDNFGIVLDVDDLNYSTYLYDHESTSFKLAKVTRVSKARDPLSNLRPTHTTKRTTKAREDLTLFIREGREVIKLVLDTAGVRKQVQTDTSGRLQVTNLDELVLATEVDVVAEPAGV